MNKYILIICICIIVGISCTSTPTIKKTNSLKDKISEKTVKKNDLVKLYYKDKLMGSLTVEEFQSMIDATDTFNEMLNAEKSNRVVVTMLKKPWIIDKKKKIYETNIKVVWMNSKNIAIKTVTLKVKLKLNETNTSGVAKKIYRDICEIVAPAAVGSTILMIFLLIILL